MQRRETVSRQKIASTKKPRGEISQSHFKLQKESQPDSTRLPQEQKVKVKPEIEAKSNNNTSLERFVAWECELCNNKITDLLAVALKVKNSLYHAFYDEPRANSK